jgi:hypothetical protein
MIVTLVKAATSYAIAVTALLPGERRLREWSTRLR